MFVGSYVTRRYFVFEFKDVSFVSPYGTTRIYEYEQRGFRENAVCGSNGNASQASSGGFDTDRNEFAPSVVSLGTVIRSGTDCR